MQRPVSVMTVLALLTLVGCSEETDPHFANGTYASSHRGAIELDCDKRVMCAEMTNDYLRKDAFEDCVRTQAMNLNDFPESRLKFHLGVNRCVGSVCQYVDCVQSGFVSYGEQQLDKVQYTCQQKVQCALDNKTLGSDPSSAFESCVIQSVLTLDTFSNEARASFQQAFFPCLPMTSCAFLSCFPY